MRTERWWKQGRGSGRPGKAALGGAVALVLALAGCVALPPTARPASPIPPWTRAPATVPPASVVPATLPPTASPTTLQCPQATPEYLAVDAVTSPTGELSQVVTVRMGNTEMVTITTESGVFTAPDGRVQVTLLPNTIHHLEVAARVRRTTQFGGCVYGGYTLHTTQDRNGVPLVIVQGQPGAPRAAKQVLTVDNVARLEELGNVRPQARQVTDFAFLGEDELLSVGYGLAEGGICGWSLVTGKQTLDIGEGVVEALVASASHDGRLIATGGTAADPAVRVWDVRSGKMQDLGRHKAYLQSVAFSPSGTLLASGGNDDSVQVWQVSSGRLARAFKGDEPKLSQAFTSLYWVDDQILIAGGATAIYWWDVTTGQMVRRLAAPEGVQFLVGSAFAEGGQRIAAVAQDNRLYVFGERWAAWPVPEAGAQLAHVAFSPDGRLVAAATYEGVFYVWDAAGGALLASRQPSGPAGGAAIRFSPSGRTLVTGGWDAPIRWWGVP
jgi:WD40 repeat protein